MKVSQGLGADGPGHRVVCSMGAFDGVHRGHRFVLAQAKLLAAQKGVLLAAVSIEDHQIPHLTSPTKKRALLQEAGVDLLVELELSPTLREVPAPAFLGLLEKAFHVVAWVQGADIHFGRNREGNAAFLARHAVQNRQDSVILDRIPGVSSTRIRQYITSGAIAPAANFLGRPYAFSVGGRFCFGPCLHVEGRELFFERPKPCLPPPGKYPVQCVAKDKIAEGSCEICSDKIVFFGCDGETGDVFSPEVEICFAATGALVP